MSKQTREFIEQLKSGEPPSLVQTLKEIGGQIWDAAKPSFNHGRDEIAAALFTGQAHVVYGHEGAGQPAQDINKELPEVQQDMGREM